MDFTGKENVEACRTPPIGYLVIRGKDNPRLLQTNIQDISACAQADEVGSRWIHWKGQCVVVMFPVPVPSSFRSFFFLAQKAEKMCLV